MMNELLWALEDARAADDVRSIVLTGEGTAFCAGGDFAEMTASATESELPHKGDYADLLLALDAQRQAGRREGERRTRMGGGLGLVAACTFAVASTEREARDAGDRRRPLPDDDHGRALSRTYRAGGSLEMMLLGERIDAEEAVAARPRQSRGRRPERSTPR